MSAHRILYDLLRANCVIADPGNAGTISPDRGMCLCNLTSAGAETRTLGRPNFEGQKMTLHQIVDAGDITVTVTGGFNETGDTTFVFSDVGQFAVFQSFATSAGVYFWRLISHYGTGNQSPAEANLLDGLTATLAEINALAAANAILTTGAGVGITSGTGTIYKTSILKIGSIYFTTIYIDITGLASISTDGDIIGVNGGGAAHIGRITAAQNGTIESMRVTCEETPAGGLADIDIYRGTVGTGVQDDSISTVTGQASTGITNFTAAGQVKCASAVPAANDYLYLLAGASSGAGTYSAGKFRIELIGY